MTPPGWLVVVDLQRVFGDADSPWTTPRFGEVRPRIRRLVEAFEGCVVFTSFVAPAEPVGAWCEYYDTYPFALQSPDAPLYELVDDPADPALSAVLTLVVTDGADEVYNGLLSDLTSVDLGTWAGDEQHDFTFTITFDATAGNEYQDAKTTLDLSWDAEQMNSQEEPEPGS